MRHAMAAVLVLFASLGFGQSATNSSASSQTARQALIEMFFAETLNHLEKHLPDATQHSLNKFSSPGDQNYLSEFSTIASQIRSGGAKFETFDVGPTLVSAQDPLPGSGPDKVEITVERDDLIGDEDQIELALHLSRDGKERPLPFVPWFIFSMQSEANVWRLNEITVTVRVPLADPAFLSTLEDQQRTRNETMVITLLRQVDLAEKRYTGSQGHFACSLSVLGTQYLYDPQLVKGTRDGFVFVISGCDATHYKVVAEPAVADSGQRAFCADESGEIRASSDGKATTCVASGEVVQEPLGDQATGVAVFTPNPATNAPAQGAVSSSSAPSPTGVVGPAPPGGSPLPQRLRVSQGVMRGLLISQVQPVYPTMGKINIEGPVVLAAVIGKDGTVQSAKIVSTPSPLLNAAALNAVKQWKFKPYLLNGQPLEVDTTLTVNFTLPKK